MTPAIFGLSGPVLTDDERAFFRESDPAGYVLFARNVKSREQLRALTDALRAIHGRERLLISIDQEGGRVARLKPPHWRQRPPAARFGALHEADPEAAREATYLNA
ncbi:MAG: beta-hexosaminidase, partial [Croceibacterium sp.]